MCTHGNGARCAIAVVLGPELVCCGCAVGSSCLVCTAVRTALEVSAGVVWTRTSSGETVAHGREQRLGGHVRGRFLQLSYLYLVDVNPRVRYPCIPV